MCHINNVYFRFVLNIFFQTVIMRGLDDGNSSGNDMLERLTQYLISPKYLPQVSWTGRGKDKERKFALSACDQLINFMVITVNKTDRRYNHEKVVNVLIYGILKRAPSKFGKTKASNRKDSPASSSNESSAASPKHSMSLQIGSQKISTPSEQMASLHQSLHHQRVMTPMNY